PGARHVEPKIVEVSKRFGVLSRFTAFLAVDRSEIANRGGKLHQVVQPVEAPAGWDMLKGGGGPGGQALAPGEVTVGAGARRLRGRAAMPSKLVGGASMRPPRPTEAAPMPQMAPPRPAPAYRSPPASLPPPPPAAQSSMPPMGGYAPPVFAEEKAKAEHGDLGVSGVFAPSVAPPTANPYLEQLAKLARELESLARGAPNPTAMRMLRQRLTEWVENVRSTGSNG